MHDKVVSGKNGSQPQVHKVFHRVDKSDVNRKKVGKGGNEDGREGGKSNFEIGRG